jgi:GT2 family glycosyltransferase
MSGDRHLSVIIPVHNGAHTLRPCLSAVAGSDYAGAEVIVVDDGSTDDSRAVARAFPCRLITLARNMGPAAARNRGAAAARGGLLFFLDSDIVVERDTLSRVVAAFGRDPTVAALFCSYGSTTVPRDFCSVYKNLLHHYTHQIAATEAATFCGGFGAIRRDLFLAMGGFDERQRWLEDVELGYRLHRAGHRILLAKEIQLTHLKRYSLLGLIRSDVVGRAIPWTRLMLRHRIVRNDLNTRAENVASVAAAWLLPPCLALAAVTPPAWAAAALLLAGLVWLNRGFLALIRRETGPVFLLGAVPMTWLTYFYSGLGLGLGVLLFLRDAARAGRWPTVPVRPSLEREGR